MSNAPYPALDVWLKHDNAGEEVTHEANTYRNEDGTHRIEWYHTAVGLVKTVELPTLEAAHEWYDREGFDDYTVID